jgi:hypothetical protein
MAWPRALCSPESVWLGDGTTGGEAGSPAGGPLGECSLFDGSGAGSL